MYEMEKEQKPAEWSEEDEKMWVHDDDIFLDAAKMIVEDSPRKSYGGVNKRSIVPWFYSLKERLKSLRPQSHWKPSEEQKNALQAFVGMIHPDARYDAVLSLLNPSKTTLAYVHYCETFIIDSTHHCTRCMFYISWLESSQTTHYKTRKMWIYNSKWRC